MKKRSKKNNLNILVEAVEICCKDEEEEEEVDRISELPDDILLCIVSHLRRFREATATKTLSSRWSRLPIPANVVYLDFFGSPLQPGRTEHGGYILSGLRYAIHDYITQANHELNSYNGGPSIDRFKVDIPCIEGGPLEKWLLFALSRETEIIDIRMIYSKVTSYDKHHYFSSYTDIPRIDIDLTLKNYSRDSLPGLKYLKELYLSGVFIDDYGELLAEFVALERLSIESPQSWTKKMCLSGDSVCMLKYLSISNIATFSYVLVSHMTNLVSLRCHGLEPFDLHIASVPELVDMSIVYARLGRDDGILARMNMINVYAQLMRLRLCIRLLDYDTGNPAPHFTKVKQMELDIEIDDECSTHQLFPLIQTCPSMEELTIKFIWPAKMVAYDDRKLDKNLSERKATIDKLKTVRLSGYIGSASELEFVLYVVKNATNLENLIIVEAPLKKYVARSKFIARAYDHLQSVIPTCINFISW